MRVRTLIILLSLVLVSVVALGDTFVREGRYNVVDADGGYVSGPHNELHTAMLAGQDWSREHEGATFYIDPPRYRGTADPPPELPREARIYTHHAGLRALYPGVFSALEVIVNNDVGQPGIDGTMPTDAMIDAGFAEGGRAFNKVERARESGAMILIDVEPPPYHAVAVDTDQVEDFIRAQARVVSHVRAMAPDLRIALYGAPMRDDRLFVGMTLIGDEWVDYPTHGFWLGRLDVELLPKLQRLDEIEGMLSDLYASVDVLTPVCYQSRVFADYWPDNPERRWHAEHWLPIYLDRAEAVAEETGVEVVPIVWHRTYSLHADGVTKTYRAADPDDFGDVLEISRGRGLDLILWEGWDDDPADSMLLIDRAIESANE